MSELPSEVYDAYDKIIGCWTNAEETIFFMFTDPDLNYNVRSMTYKIDGKIKSVEYFFTMLFDGKNKFILHKRLPVQPFQHGNLILEFIGEDMIEIKYYDDFTFTLMKMKSGFEKIFEG